MDWLQSYLDEVKNSESPRKYFIWSGLTAISAVLRDNVYLDRGGLYQLFPNVFTVFIGPSGIKKGNPVTYARKLVKYAGNTRIYTGRLTIEKLISELSKSHSVESGEIMKDAIALFSAGEFSSFIARNPEALTILTDLYNTHEYRDEDWINYTKKDDKEKLHHPCITIIGASNETHFREVVPDNAVGGGFIARTFLVNATKRGKLNSLTKRAPEPELKKLAEYLKELGKVKGEFQWTNEAEEIYDKWYYEFGETDRNDDTGTLNRVTDSVLKVAMLLSCSRSMDLMLYPENIVQAIDLCEDVVLGIKKLTSGSGRNPLGPMQAMIIRFLLKQEDYVASREEILDKHWGHFDSYDLDRIVQSMSDAKQIVMVSLAGGPKYRLTDKIIANFETKILGKGKQTND